MAEKERTLGMQLGFGEMSEPGDKPFWAKCAACSHCWAAAYLPMDVRTLAKLTKNVRCPRCGAPKPVVAKQDDGILREEAANG